MKQQGFCLLCHGVMQGIYILQAIHLVFWFIFCRQFTYHGGISAGNSHIMAGFLPCFAGFSPYGKKIT
jgi:hypothetical protein